MLTNNGFDLWATSYDLSVKKIDKNNQYPFAGYNQLMNAIYGTIMKDSSVNVFDIGFGTAMLTSKLYEAGHTITGIDFSTEMIKIASEKMPNANLIQWDFTKGLPYMLDKQSFDYIISTYALHHLTDESKYELILSLLELLTTDGTILIGDVGFLTRDELLKCKEISDTSWDDDEIYFVFSELEVLLSASCQLNFYKFSFCAGIIEIKKK